MKNTGITYSSTERTPAIAPAFADLLPPLSDEQYAALEADILQNGCYSPVIVNEDHIVIDGHHRQEICEKHGIPYNVAVFSFEDDLEAKQWALDTQKARRSLSTWELGQIALKLKPEFEARAEARHAANGGDKKSAEAKSASMNSSKPIVEGIDTRKELSKIAGLGEETMGRIMKIDERAPEVVKAAMDDGMSVNAGYNITRLLEKLPEEAREAAAERAVELAKQRKDYKAVFDLSFDEMNTLIKDDGEAEDTLRVALNTGEVSVNGGKDAARILLDMPKEERELADLSDTEGLAELEADYRKQVKAVDKSADIAVAYNSAFEKVLSVNGTDHEVRMWLEYSGIRKTAYTGLIAEAEDAAERFTKVATVLKQIYETEVAPYEHLYDDCAE